MIRGFYLGVDVSLITSKLREDVNSCVSRPPAPLGLLQPEMQKPPAAAWRAVILRKPSLITPPLPELRLRLVWAPRWSDQI